MSGILNIEQLKQLATPIIEIPDFQNEGTIKVRVQKPRLMAMAAQGKIPNHLIGIANDMMFGGAKKKKENLNIKDAAGMMELYCEVCLVEPRYEDFRDIMTDEQMLAIFNWAMGTVSQLDNFRKNEKDGTGDNTSEPVSEKAERNTEP